MKKVILLSVALLLQISATENLKAQTKTKTKKDYERIYANHDYSINISGNNTNTTYFGRLGSETMACNRYMNEKFIEHTIELVDENILLINKLNDNTLSFHLIGMSVAKRNIVKFTNITQKDDVVYFNISFRKNNIRRCAIKLPKGIENFMDIFPVVFNGTEKCSPNAEFMENISHAIFFEIFKYIKDTMVEQHKICYESSIQLGLLSIKNGMSYKSFHYEMHEECGSSGTK